MKTDYESLKSQYAAKGDDYYEQDRREMLEFIPPDAETILDVGCGSGTFGQLVKQEINCIYWGIEPDAASAEKAALRLDKVINSTFSADLPEIENQSFDVICFNDVLEHLTNPEEILELCRNKLTEKGIIVASIPNILFFHTMVDIIVRQDWQYQESGVLDKTHLRFFTKKSIIRMFENSGYEIIKIAGINSSSGLKYKILNVLLLNHLKDWRHLQFVVQAKIRDISQ